VLSNLLWAVLALLAALAAGGLARLVWVAFAWRLLYRRLVRRTSETEASAWLWMLAALGRTGARMPAHRSPDQVATGDLSGLHDALHEPVQALAGSVTLAVFGAPGVTPVDTNAWLLARKASDAAWSSVGRAGRLRARFRAPGAENRLDRGSQPAPRPMTSRSS
jgi:hypothetical protein